ncbi:hypothetical protein BC834DRAFT_998359 [Gloeopeniophorella convolvens]|nr:hypothetical protein BC834DRAFT_998359 [Gloeopeniophorella convolvens]
MSPQQSVQVSGGRDSSSQPRDVHVLVTVLRADGLPSIKSLFSKNRRYYVVVTDGVRTKKTRAVQSRDRTVQWNEVLADFDGRSSSYLAFRILGRRKFRPDVLVGTLEVPFESLRSTSRDFDLSLSNDGAARPAQRATLSLAIAGSQALGDTSAATMAASESAQSPTMEAEGIGSDVAPVAQILLDTDEALHHVIPGSAPALAVADVAESAPGVAAGATNLYNTWENAIDQIKWFMGVVDQLSEIHPYAKMAWSVLSFIPKAFLDQNQRDNNIRALLITIHDVFDLANVAESLKTIHPSSRQIIRKRHATLYVTNSSGLDDRVEGYRAKLTNLRDDFLRHATVTTEMTALQIQGGVENVSVQVHKVYTRLEGISRQLEEVSGEVLSLGLDAKISEIPYRAGSRFRPDKGCLQGTRIGFLDHITDWVNNPEAPRTLILYGQAGTGKSSIAHDIAHRFDSMHRLSSSYMFRRTEKSKRDAHLLFTNLARDLADRYPQFKTSLGKAVADNTSIRRGAQDYGTLFECLLEKPLSKAHLIGPVFVVIDALDESGDATGDDGLHSFLASHISKLPSNFRFLISSRPESDIERAFTGAASVRFLRMDDSELSKKTGDDIRSFFRSSLPEFIFNNHGDELTKKAEGLFQWAAVTCGYIKQPPRGLTKADCILRLLRPSSGHRRMDPLDELYRTVLSAYFDDPDVRHRFRSVMGQLLAGFEAFNVHSLTSLRQYSRPEDRDDDESVFAIVSPLGSLLSNVSSPDSTLPIVPVHTSFRDFLMDKSRSGAFYVDINLAHHQLAYLTLRIMVHKLHLNLCDLETSYLLTKISPIFHHA